MNPITVSAQFAAYVWFGECCNNTGKSYAAAMEFARENWQAFLPVAQPGLGTLLLKIAGQRPTSKKILDSATANSIQSLASAAFSSN